MTSRSTQRSAGVHGGWTARRTRVPAEGSASQHQRALADAIAAVRKQLERRAGQRDVSGVASSAAKPPPLSPPLSPPPESALGRLSLAFELSPFELSVLVLAAGAELDPAVAQACGALHCDAARSWPSFGLALAALDRADWSALLPDSPLRRARLIGLGEGEILTRRQIFLEERVLHALMGAELVDARLARRVRELPGQTPLATSHEQLVESVVERLNDARKPLVQLLADAPQAAVLVAARVWHQQGRRALLLGAGSVPLDAAERDELLHLVEREATLAALGLVLQLDEAVVPAHAAVAADFACRVRAPLLVVGKDALQAVERSVVRLRVPDAPFAENLALWRAALSDVTALDAAALASLVAQFRLDAAAIADLASELPAAGDASSTPAQALWRACRTRARPKLEELAQRVETDSDFERLVLPPSQQSALRALVGQVKHKARVQHTWGLSPKNGRGQGTSALFAGASGTGKTMAAEAVAAELELDLFRIDLSAVVSKYIGETEENLRRVFDAAESGGAILLFDEADALFGKRTEVKDSHDRHANIEVSYLLQRMEMYGGLSILTTNLRRAIDDAFLRRLQFVVEFPFPDAAQRERIWQGIFPQQLPRSELKYAQLAQLSVAGGNIKSIARNAAYLAADEDRPLAMAHLLEAARLECVKLSRPLPPHETKGWIHVE